MIYELLRPLDLEMPEDAHQAQVRQSTNQALLENAKIGLRTLVIAEKTISPEAYQEWS